MSFKRGGHKRPQYSISTSVAVRKGKYLKGPSFGLWINDDNDVPMARGSVKENYLSELAAFLRKAESKDLSVSFALFKNKDKKRRDEDDDDSDDDEEEAEEKDTDSDDDEEEDEDEKPAKKASKKAAKKSSKKGKKSDWDFDSEDDE